MTAVSALAAPEARLEGVDKVTGRARYAADTRMEGQLHVVFVRSPYPHARISSVDIGAARAMEGVELVLTGADVRPMCLGRRLQDWPILAWDRVRLVGDRVALVAATTRRRALEAAAAVHVEYEELPTVLTMDQALAPDAPVLHPEAAAYRYLGGDRPRVPHPNIQGRRLHQHGEPDVGFRMAPHVFDHTFETAPVFPGHLEPRAALVSYDGATYRVTSTNKSPFQLRRQMAASLGVDPESIVVDSGHIGGDFGGKGLSIDEYALAIVARRTGRPASSVETYEEDMMATSVRHGSRVRLRTAVDDDGTIIAHEAFVHLNGGAYAAAKPGAWLVPGDAMATLAGYQVPSARIEALTFYTNSAPAGNARAPGQPQNSFAAESHLDLIAEALGISPFDIRRRNILRPGGTDVAGEIWPTSPLPVVLDTLEAEFDLAGSPVAATGPRRRGRGIAIGARPSPVPGPGGLSASVGIMVTDDARVRLSTGVPDQGGGAHTALARIVGFEMAIDAGTVVVVREPTDKAAFDAGIGGGRVTPVVGGAAQRAARLLKALLDDRFPGLSVSRQLVQAAGSVEFRIQADFTHDEGFNSTCAYGVEVAVDVETGVVEVVDCVLVADVGALINPVAGRGQLVGGFAFGIGQTLFEELRSEAGTPVTVNLGDYKLPTMPDVPGLRVVVVTDDPGGGPYGSKSIGELANPSIGPAVANAIADAVGIRVRSLPITPAKVLAAMARSGREEEREAR